MCLMLLMLGRMVAWFRIRCRVLRHRRWGQLDDVRSDDGMVQSCREFCSVRGPLQSVQRAELQGVILG